MYFKFRCPHCEKSLKVREELAGKKCACPYCKASVRIPQETPAAAPEEAGPPSGFPNLDLNVAPRPGRPQKPPRVAKRKSAEEAKPAPSHGQWTDSSNVSLLKSGLIGLAASVVFLLLMLPLRGFVLGQLFWDRGWVPFVLVLLMFWSFAILILKWQKLARQRRSMLLDVLPTELSQEITLESLDKFAGHLQDLPGEPGESFLINRVSRGIEHFRVRRNAAETVTMMESQSTIDANNVASSYTILKVFVWALPIMGFIGTVIGVSAAVASLAGSLENASDVSAIKGALNSVFAGLGTAFDTTLLALIMSLLVKVPMSAMQKAEEDLVTWVDEYCNENLLRRLNDGREIAGPSAAETTPDAEAFRRALDAAFAKQLAEAQRWGERLEVTSAQITTQVAEGWSEINQQLQETLTALGEQIGTVQQQATAAVQSTGQNLQVHFAGIERGLEGLNGVLERLGEQQVVIQQNTPPKRRWFSRRANGET